MYKSATLAIFLLFCNVLVFAQQKAIVKLYDSVRKQVPREKLYLHFDKNNYTNLDTIWFKAYLVDATLNTPSTKSGLIYTEIIDEDNDVIESLALPTVSGLSWGAFALDEKKFETGTYTFRAYTNWMQNFGDTYFFQKQFNVFSLTAGTEKMPLSTARTKQPNISQGNTAIAIAKKIDLQFLPEGGNLIAGNRQKIGFKALNANGKGVVLSGDILDSKGNVVANFNSNNKGMGMFLLSTIANEKYSAVINNLPGIDFKLPAVKELTTSLKITNDIKSDSLIIQLNPALSQSVTIIGQSRGVICFFADLPASTSTKIIRVAKSIFPTGVCQILVLDPQRKVLNERNFFNNLRDGIKLDVMPDKISYANRDSVQLRIKALATDQKPVQMSLSIAVTDDTQVMKDSDNDVNILSYLLLSSDLKGEIENPSSYFTSYDEQTHNNLEALMLTQGWVNYDWDLSKKPIFKSEKEFILSGKITNLTNTPIANAKVTMVGQNKGFTLIDTVANDKGEFVFDQLPMMDSASFVVQALNTKGKRGTLGIEVNEFVRPAVNIVKPKNVFLEGAVDSISTVLVKTQNDALNKRYASGNLLKEVTITGKRSIPGSKNLNGPGEADQILTEEDLNKVAKLTLYDLLTKKVKGFRAGVPRGSNNMEFFINSEPAKFVVDGMELDFFYESSAGPSINEYYYFVRDFLDYYAAEDVKGVEVMRNFSTSMRYKTRFIDNPLDPVQYSFIEVTTKSGHGPFLKKRANIYKYRPMNYGSNKVFYSPKYTADNTDKMPDFRSTIYWHPNIITDENGDAKVTFFTSDRKGTYTVWLEGTDLEGNFGVKTMKLEVK
ncbi:MAG: hypothetical protein EOO47_07225 [Flavobacterium sp.]|nr:MAG: hypothetical protein EOO47_07225 [Flavobacterium sp.]